MIIGVGEGRTEIPDDVIRWITSTVILAGWVSNPEVSGNNEEIAKDAIEFADNLLKQLAKAPND